MDGVMDDAMGAAKDSGRGDASMRRVAIALASTARGAGRRDSASITAACSRSAAASATPSAFRS